MESASKGPWIFLLVAVFLCCKFSPSESVKLKFAAKDDCDRFSLDALYYDKFRHITDDVFADSVEFVHRVTKLTGDSLIAIMAKLPGRDSSDREELSVIRKFENLHRRFDKEVKIMQKNITKTWTTLMAVNFDLLMDKDNSSLDLLQQCVSSISDSYREARVNLHSTFALVLAPIKVIVRNGLQSIIDAARAEMQKRPSANDTDTEEVRDDDKKDVDEGLLRKTVANITTTIVPAFLGAVSLKVYEKQIDLHKQVKPDYKDIDSPLDDVYFSIIMMQKRVHSLTHLDLSKSKEDRDLARRNVYMYWTDLATAMYEEKLKGSGAYTTTSSSRKEKYQKLWRSEEDIVDTFINLMQIYP